MRLNAGCEIGFKVTAPTPMILMLRPRSGTGQWISNEAYELQPHAPAIEFVDIYGNLCQRLVAPIGDFIIRATVSVETADTIDVNPGAPLTPIEQLPDGVLHFLLPSRYCQSDRVGDQANQIVQGSTPGYDQAEAIRAWIQRNIEYRYGVSDASTSVLDTLMQRAGVCRDFAHLGAALCRSINVPARIVVGYLYQLEPMDLHAWFEAYVAGRWYIFDATQQAPKGGRIAIAYGRDATDVALATQYGPAALTDMQVWVYQ